MIVAIAVVLRPAIAAESSVDFLFESSARNDQNSETGDGHPNKQRCSAEPMVPKQNPAQANSEKRKAKIVTRTHDGHAQRRVNRLAEAG